MKVWTVFNGGVNYSPGSPHELRDIEEFESLRAAGEEFYIRVRGFHPEFGNVDRETASMHVWLACPNDGQGDVQEYPDRVITVGPRDGIRAERV